MSEFDLWLKHVRRVLYLFMELFPVHIKVTGLDVHIAGKYF